MIDVESIKLFLPKYLSSESFEKLIQELKNFPDNIDNRFYSKKLENDIIYQGDGIDNFLLINLPDTKTTNGKVIILSNTCDIDLSNERKFESRICYAPIFDLDKYKELLNQIYNEQQINEHLRKIRNQEITQIFYLPKGFLNNSEGVVFLDRIINCNNNFINRESLSKYRVFSLSNYGWYLFLYKLSIHFTRMHEKVDRKSAIRGVS